MVSSFKIAVIIPCYKVKSHILGVLKRIGDDVDRIYVVDDCCPESSGDCVGLNVQDHRVCVLKNAVNMGVGGAVIAGYRMAMADGMDILVKLDGDGQMDPALIGRLIRPIVSGRADYTKGNRFYDLEKLSSMPSIRKFGNAVLSFMTKISSGYWNVFDPTNGFTAIHRSVAAMIPFEKVSTRYFFETDMLFRLNTIRAVVFDVPMDSVYGDEKSNLKISNIFFEFLSKHALNFCKRIVYSYFIRDMSLASIELPVGVLLIMFSLVFGSYHWVLSIEAGVVASPGTVMLSSLPLIVGLQFVLAFVGHDVSVVPDRPIHSIMSDGD